MAMMTMSNMMNLKSLHAWTKDLGHSQLMPTIFFGHGSPMNAIQDNDFTKAFKNVGHEITKPKAIICVSAHWETRGTKITAMQHPRTIHDFGGFPRVLHESIMNGDLTMVPGVYCDMSILMLTFPFYN